MLREVENSYDGASIHQAVSECFICEYETVAEKKSERVRSSMREGVKDLNTWLVNNENLLQDTKEILDLNYEFGGTAPQIYNVRRMKEEKEKKEKEEKEEEKEKEEKKEKMKWCINVISHSVLLLLTILYVIYEKVEAKQKVKVHKRNKEKEKRKREREKERDRNRETEREKEREMDG